MWFVFRRSRKTNHLSSLLRERSERKRYQNHSVLSKNVEFGLCPPLR
ncbi:MAG: hypothetical protein U5L45_06055 [Saprospiraceae bacterium]|nr:hypothetical protein [Saprospiraceae bacterium]